MKTKKSIILFGVTSALFVVGMTLVTAQSSNANIVKIAQADTEKDIVITSSMLAATQLEDWRHPKKVYKGNETDKKFTIDLGNGKYINGALVFRDCDYQYCGNTLADTFGFNNTANNSNTMNFNFFFSFEKIIRTTWKYTAYGNLTDKYVREEIKYSVVNNEAFYDGLGSYDYEEIVNSAGDLDHGLFPDYNAADAWTYIPSQSHDRVFGSSHWESELGPANLVAYQLMSPYEDGYASGTHNYFNFTELTFKISCL